MAARSSTRREPQIELRKLTEDYCEFVLKNTDVSMANALRRIILVEVCGCCCWVLQAGSLAGTLAAGLGSMVRNCRGCLHLAKSTECLAT